MIYKSPKVIFSLLFLFFLVGLFFTFDFYKQKEINKALENSKKRFYIGIVKFLETILNLVNLYILMSL